jgi:starch synthase
MAEVEVLFLSSELVPYSKTGGLADVAGALPAALRAGGHRVLAVTPLYGSIDRAGLVPGEVGGEVQLGFHRLSWSGWTDPAGTTWFVDIPGLYDRGSLYTNGGDEHLRFAALGEASLQLAHARGWPIGIVHCNDWQTGLVPATLRGRWAHHPVLGRAGVVMTIHNLGYQGRFGAGVAGSLGLDGHEYLLHRDHLADGYVSFLETGILHADVITTVSPTYAREIQTPEGGAGLDGPLEARSDDVVGILNGIDSTEWNPRLDRLIPARFSAKSLWRKELNKEALLTGAGLEYRKHVPVIGIVTRLAHQKGIEIMRGPLLHFLETWDLRLVVLGSGQPEYEAFFRWLTERHPDKAVFVNGYDNRLSHLIEAGSDLFVMPSLYEPCGLNQMYSLAYGTIPVVRRVGGLADTVVQADVETGTGTGVVFDDFTEDGLGWALGRALTMHLDRRGWQLIQRNGMAIDNSWAQRAEQYLELYRRVLAAR